MHFNDIFTVYKGYMEMSTKFFFYIGIFIKKTLENLLAEINAKSFL